MEKIQVSAVFPNIAPADLAAFKQVAAAALELTIPEPGTLHYDWFFSEDETKCVVREVYANSDAMLAHLGNVGELLGRRSSSVAASSPKGSALLPLSSLRQSLHSMPRCTGTFRASRAAGDRASAGRFP